LVTSSGGVALGAGFCPATIATEAKAKKNKAANRRLCCLGRSAGIDDSDILMRFKSNPILDNYSKFCKTFV